MIMKAGFVDDLKNINSAEDVYGVIDKYSDNKIEENTNIEKTYTSETNSNTISVDSKDFIVAVTACPNDIEPILIWLKKALKKLQEKLEWI